MGCVSSKLVPESPPPGAVVKTVYPPDQINNNKNLKQDGHLASQNLYSKPDRPGRRRATKTDTNDEQKAGGAPARTTTTHGGKYRAKFDPRVTAKYDIKALIGRGSFSRVVRVEHRITKQPYAIKMVDRVQGKEVCEAELNVLRRVRHICIIQLIEVFDSKEKLYMVMELATGGELFDRIIAKGSFTERDATRVLNMVLDGVRYLHSLGIAHRDLKPENLLYYHPGQDSKILITDFGLSAFCRTGESFLKTTCGTPEYIAPEILARNPYTCQVDLWAVGVITYILLSGTMPFDDDNRTRLYRSILKLKYNFVGEVMYLFYLLRLRFFTFDIVSGSLTFGCCISVTFQ